MSLIRLSFTRAAFILLSINRRYVSITLRSSMRFSKCKVLNCGADRTTRVRLVGDQAAIYIHLDDFGIFGSCEEVVVSLRAEMRSVFEAAGFLITEESPMHGGRYSGLEPVLDPPGWAPELVKLGMLDMVLARCRPGESIHWGCHCTVMFYQSGVQSIVIFSGESSLK